MLNPILIGAGIVMIVLCLLKVPVADYQEGCKPLSYLMTPATICLGISFAEQVEKLKKHIAAIIADVVAGTICSLSSVVGMAYLFGMDRVMTISVLPKCHHDVSTQYRYNPYLTQSLLKCVIFPTFVTCHIPPG